MTINRSNTPSLTRKRGGSTSSLRNPYKLAGSSTHESMHDEPSFVKLHASHDQTMDGFPHMYNPKVRPSRGKRILTGKGTKADKYWPEPCEYGPNYQHNLAKDHFGRGGWAIGDWMEKVHTPRSLWAKGGPTTDDLHQMGEAIHAACGMWIQQAIKHPGSLRTSLKVPKGLKIPTSKLEKATHAKSPLMRKRANLALTLKRFHHKG